MKLFNPLHLSVTAPLLLSGMLCQPALAVTSVSGQDQLRIHTSLPKKASDSLFSYTTEWRVDSGDLYRATGIGFFNAAKIDASSDGTLITKKLFNALKDGLMHLEPIWRGITINNPENQTLLSIANKDGYSLTSITVRDYTNQSLKYDLADKSFSASGVQIALDLVLAADVEYIEGFTTKKSSTASEGEIVITVDDQQPIIIKTDGKTTRALEEEIAKQLASSQLSQTALVSSFVSFYDKNNKPFDGSEVQLSTFAANSIAIDITDPNLGILTKFKFKDENSTVRVNDPLFLFPILLLTTMLIGCYIWFRKTNKPE